MNEVNSPKLSRRVMLGALAAAIAAPAIAQQAGQVQNLTADEARQRALSGEIILIDLRTEAEWKESGIPDVAQPIDVYRADFMQRLMAVVGDDKSKPIALICQSGQRSGYASGVLVESGFAKVYDVAEGTHGSRAGPGWLKRGLPTKQP